MKTKFNKILKNYQEAYEGFSKCWYMYYSTKNKDNNCHNKEMKL